ncbi:MAG TPA: CRISPR-associated helicase Cas3' [Blastocatellia bacterium]|nr:CRISPR-associated helicase Cas3' [Blastocatellia bacterium]
MTTQYATYDDFFRAAFNWEPFDYQRRLALDNPLPSLVNVPTGAGKTAAVIGAWLWRRLQNDSSVGRRLIYCLPMRTLVEQTRDVTKAAITKLETEWPTLKDRFQVRVLMGGTVSREWDTEPERECILIGTQDMLLSRALNRGYAMSRFRWPIQFGLLNNDCFWVFDEIQLMGDGLATATQLAAFREQFKTFGPSRSIWMSATLDAQWLKTIDFATQVSKLKQLTLSEEDKTASILKCRLEAKKILAKADYKCRLPKDLAEFIREKHKPGTQTLVVVNRVARAQEIYEELAARPKGKKKSAQNADPNIPEIKLIHSRFRPSERRRWADVLNAIPDPDGAGRIIIATQVVEAGLDISSRLLITDLAPWASLVQRFGRCNRKGEFEEAFIYWIDRPLNQKDEKLSDKADDELEEKDQQKIASPYKWDDLQRARERLKGLTSAAPADLPQHSDEYVPAHVLRRRDLVDLFDTTPDLSGYDLDVSRFVRGADERNVSIAWRDLGGQAPMKKTPAPTRNELCPVPVGHLRLFLSKENKAKKKREAWMWDALMGEWRKAEDNSIRPGLTLLLDVSEGGYDSELGWSTDSKEPVAPTPRESEEPEESYEDDLLSHLKYRQSLAAHSAEARAKAELIVNALADIELDEWRDDLVFATHHHDWGKAHEVFQETLHRGLPEDLSEVLLAKSDRNLPSPEGKRGHSRAFFRHELASALALLQTGASDLAVYLAACHHGKVRLSIRALPGENRPDGNEKKFARGIWDKDLLPATDLGEGVITPKLELDLEPMLLGASADGSRSWLERMIALRNRLGVFRLAFLEALIRAADVRASRYPVDVLPSEEVSE